MKPKTKLLIPNSLFIVLSGLEVKASADELPKIASKLATATARFQIDSPSEKQLPETAAQDSEAAVEEECNAVETP